jgi:hypothetical protein
MMSTPSYCFWSLATGPYADQMEQCIASARAAGVFKEFHVLTDRPIEGAESYDAHEVELTDKLFKLVYLKAAISKLNFDYYVWIDGDTRFRRTPRNLLACLGRSPIHAPLEISLSALVGAAEPSGRATSVAQSGRQSDAQDSDSIATVNVTLPHPRLQGLTIRDYVKLFKDAGVINPVYWSRSGFWIVRRTAVEKVCELALHFRAFAKEREIETDVSAGLSYAMQMLCGDPARHLVSERPDLWADLFDGTEEEVDSPGALNTKCPMTGKLNSTNPAIIHLSQSWMTGSTSRPSLEKVEKNESVNVT